MQRPGGALARASYPGDQQRQDKDKQAAGVRQRRGLEQGAGQDCCVAGVPSGPTATTRSDGVPGASSACLMPRSSWATPQTSTR